MRSSDHDRGEKRYASGTERAVPPEETIANVQGFLLAMGITRVADVTGLDHVGIPVAAAYRPNARSVSVSQGKGTSVAAARASAVMEAIEGYHAERVTAPLRLATTREMAARLDAVPVERLARVAGGLDVDAKLLWVEGCELRRGGVRWLPLEVVQTDFTLPVVGCSGAFLMSSNGLASGNHILEAVSHGVCELVERDANTLWHFSSAAYRATRRVSLDGVTGAPLRSLLERLTLAEVEVAVWETTTDIGIASFLCQLGDRRARLQPLPFTSGSGCHPRREIALSRAITEAAQGRVTRIAAVREDLDDALYSAEATVAENARVARLLASEPPIRSFSDAPDVVHGTFSEDVDWEVERLSAAGLETVVMVDLTRPEFKVPVVKIVIPGLEGMAEVPGYVLGPRVEKWKSSQAN